MHEVPVHAHEELAECFWRLRERPPHPVIVADPGVTAPPQAVLSPAIRMFVVLRGNDIAAYPRRGGICRDPLPDGSALLLPPECWILRRQRSRYDVLALRWDPQRSRVLRRTRCRGGSLRMGFADLPPPDAAMAGLLDCLRLQAARRDELVLQRLLPAICAALAPLFHEHADPPPSGAAASWSLLEEHLHDHACGDLDRRTVAEACGMHPGQVTRLCRRFAGCGFSGYLDLLRYQQALSLLRDSELSVATIAERCGYGSSQYFIRRFRRRSGLSPGAWRHQRVRGRQGSQS